MTDETRVQFLNRLDDACIAVTVSEANIIEETWNSDIFTDRQRKGIDRMYERYAAQLKLPSLEALKAT